MRPAVYAAAVLLAALALTPAPAPGEDPPAFRTADRCVACHNGLKSKSGEDVSIGLDWRPTMMANSARDPYWQGSVRRETLDHPESAAAIQDECATCHMPMAHLMDHAQNRQTALFSQLPFKAGSTLPAADGVTCSVCHQIAADGLGTPDTYNGHIQIATPADPYQRPEYGPFVVDHGHQRVMQSSTGGFIPVAAPHMRDSALCGSCHTLITTALGPDGKPIGSLPEQVPYQEWLHSSYRDQQSCQQCHMPEVAEGTPVTALYGPTRKGLHRHEFLGGNFMMEAILNLHRDELGVEALPAELDQAAGRSRAFLSREAARLEIQNLSVTSEGVSFAVRVQNRTGHKLPTAYPSRRAWLHVVVKNAAGQPVFESGALRPDGSIAGNSNDADPARYEPHRAEITRSGQVQIFESILGDSEGHVTTGLLKATGYLKDNRILPAGFDKATADPLIAVHGEALADPAFAAGFATTRYRIGAAGAGPYTVTVELCYQPIAFRWAHNLAGYPAAEPQRFAGYYNGQAGQSAQVLAQAQASTP